MHSRLITKSDMFLTSIFNPWLELNGPCGMQIRFVANVIVIPFLILGRADPSFEYQYTIHRNRNTSKFRINSIHPLPVMHTQSQSHTTFMHFNKNIQRNSTVCVCELICFHFFTVCGGVFIDFLFKIETRTIRRRRRE